MHKSDKWMHLLVLMTFLVSTMPFASHAGMLHPVSASSIQMDDAADPADCGSHHQKSDEQKQDITAHQDCECLATGCYNTVLTILTCSNYSGYITQTIFAAIDEYIRPAHVNRLERPPRT